MAHNSQGSLLSASTQALERVILPANQTYSDIFSSIEEPIFLQAYGLTGDPETDYIALEAVHLSPSGNTYVDYAPAGVQRFNRLTNNAIIRERGHWRLRRVGNPSAFVSLMVGSNIHELPDDYWAERFRIGRGEGVTSVTGQNTPSVNVTAAPTTGAVNIFANVNISPDAGNTVSVRPNGVYGRGPLNGDIVDAITSVTDTNTIDHTLLNNNLSSNVRISSDSGNVIEARSGGLFVPAAAASPVQAVVGSSSTTWLQNVTTSNGTVTVSGSVRFSPAANNQASDDGQGVWVPRGAGLTLDTSGVQTATFTPNVTLTNGVLRISGDARVSATAGNQITTNADGLFVAPASAGVSSLTLNDTNTVDFTSSGTNGAITASAVVKISAAGGNIISVNADGLYAAAQPVNFATRLQSGIARYATESQLEQHTNENAADGGYIVSSYSLNHFMNARNNSGFDHLRIGIDAQKGPGAEIDWPKGLFVGNEAGKNVGGYAFTEGQRPSIIIGNRALNGSEVSGSIVIANASNGAYNESTVIGPSDITDANNPYVFGAANNSVIIGKPNSPYDLFNGVAVGNNITFAASSPGITAWDSVDNTTFIVTSPAHPVPPNSYRVLRIIGSNPDKFVVCKYISPTQFELTSVKRGLVPFDNTWTSYDITGRSLNCIAIGNNSLLAAGQARIGNETDISSTYLFGNVFNNGNITCVSLIETSDSRIKKNKQQATGCLEIVESLKATTFEYDEDSDFIKNKNMLVESGVQLGLIAQDVEAVLPSAVSETDDGLKHIKYNQIVSALVGAVNELAARVRELESR